MVGVRVVYILIVFSQSSLRVLHENGNELLFGTTSTITNSIGHNQDFVFFMKMTMNCCSEQEAATIACTRGFDLVAKFSCNRSKLLASAVNISHL